MKIGVFDSGVGGQHVAKAVQVAFADHEIVYAEDRAHVPYGSKDMDEVYGYVVPILQRLIDDGCRVIVIACNTVSTNLIVRLRELFSIPLVAMEPMVKPAAQLTKSGVIAVCATPATLKSERYNWLKKEYAAGVTVLEPDCSSWSSMIERNVMDRQQLDRTILEVINEGADVIVLGCTHYHWIEQEIQEIAAGRATVLQPELPVIAQLGRVLARL